MSVLKTLITNSDSAKLEIELPVKSFKELLAIVPASGVNTFFENCITDIYNSMHYCRSQVEEATAKGERIAVRKFEDYKDIDDHESEKINELHEFQEQWNELVKSSTEYDELIAAQREEKELNELGEQWRSLSSTPTSKEEVELLHKKMKKVLAEYRKNN